MFRLGPFNIRRVRYFGIDATWGLGLGPTRLGGTRKPPRRSRAWSTEWLLKQHCAIVLASFDVEVAKAAIVLASLNAETEIRGRIRERPAPDTAGHRRSIIGPKGNGQQGNRQYCNREGCSTSLQRG